MRLFSSARFSSRISRSCCSRSSFSVCDIESLWKLLIKTFRSSIIRVPRYAFLFGSTFIACIQDSHCAFLRRGQSGPSALYKLHTLQVVPWFDNEKHNSQITDRWYHWSGDHWSLNLCMTLTTDHAQFHWYHKVLVRLYHWSGTAEPLTIDHWSSAIADHWSRGIISLWMAKFLMFTFASFINARVVT